jgi:hypothetical protein
MSPAAQAVFSAWAKPVDVDRSLVASGQALEAQARGALAAALQAAADQLPLQPLTRDPADPFEQGLRQGQELSRAELLAIAAELEGALWLNEASLDLYPGDRGIVVNALYDQANQ